MKIIRDEETFGLFMIPLFFDWHVRRCNIQDCREKPSTIVAECGEGIPVFGLCEKHYTKFRDEGEINARLIFDDYDAFSQPAPDSAEPLATP